MDEYPLTPNIKKACKRVVQWGANVILGVTEIDNFNFTPCTFQRIKRQDQGNFRTVFYHATHRSSIKR